MRWGARFAAKAALGLVAVAVMGWVVMALWNAVVPGLLAGAREVDYLHALGLLVLCRILFGGFRGHGGHWGWHGRRHHWAQKWQAMTEEEREQFLRSGPSWGRKWRSGAPE